MKGSTHLAIGIMIGAAASVVYPFTVKNAVLYITVAAFSALSADLDGPSLLSSKLGPVSRMLRHLMLGGGFLLPAWVAYLYFSQQLFYVELAAAAVMVCLLGFIAKQGVIRNTLVSLVGGILLYAGLQTAMTWLAGFGLFVVWVPWLKHRGMSHTLWAVLIWAAIAWGLEQELQLTGITAVAVAGYLSHLFADTLTPNGVKWLYPLYKKSIKLRM